MQTIARLLSDRALVLPINRVRIPSPAVDKDRNVGNMKSVFLACYWNRKKKIKV